MTGTGRGRGARFAQPTPGHPCDPPAPDWQGSRQGSYCPSTGHPQPGVAGILHAGTLSGTQGGAGSLVPWINQSWGQRERRPSFVLLRLCLIWGAGGQWLWARLQNRKAGSKSWFCLLGHVTLDKTLGDLPAAPRDAVKINYDIKRILQGLIESASLKSSIAWSLETWMLEPNCLGSNPSSTIS